VERDKPTRSNESDVYYQTSISTCFGHHYAHHQENKTVYYCIWCSALVVLVMVVWSWVVRCVHCVKVTVRTVTFTQFTQPQTAQPVQNTIRSNTRSCSPDDGHNDARNMLRCKFDNKHRISCILLVYLSSPYVPRCTVTRTSNIHYLIYTCKNISK